MNGIHDVGGMDGFGPVDTTEHADTFHEDWEGVTYATFVAGLGNGVFGIDAFRHSIERMPPRDYLDERYYERWIRATTRLFVERGVVAPGEFAARTRAFEAGEATVPERQNPDPDLLGELVAGVREAYDSERDEREPRFAEGDEVVVRNVHPRGHTRCPRYVRRARGVVRAVRGTHTLPDASAHGEERAEPLYNVQFDGAELWSDRESGTDGRAGADTAGTRVSLDLWESYLRPPEQE